MNREVKSLKLPFCLKHLEIFLRKSVQVVCLNFGDDMTVAPIYPITINHISLLEQLEIKKYKAFKRIEEMKAVNCKSMRNRRMADAHICIYFGYQLAMVHMVSPVPSGMIGND